ncbi:MAG: SufD family Fe-S cluster assembly protein, partial [Muribaculaceae bacterium]|nr:SufD family Fe-S cluster assembly protein [Muribaculaceae bacterium]
DHTYNSSARFLSSEVIEIAMSDGAHLDYYTIEESSPLTTRHSQLFARQSSRSDLMIGSCTLTAGNTRNSFVVTDAAPGAVTHIAGMAIASAEMHVDNSVNMIHCTDHTNSRQLFKYVVSDKASCAFSGRILVSPDAAYTDAYQTCRSVLDGPDARMYSKPQLEIYNDEVKCSHGTTTGQLDNEALFYMQTRGIPLHEARIMLMQAFMADVIDTVRLDPLRDRLRHLVDARFSGASSAACSSCQAPTCSK